jgi:hypothetical protein
MAEIPMNAIAPKAAGSHRSCSRFGAMPMRSPVRGSRRVAMSGNPVIAVSPEGRRKQQMRERPGSCQRTEVRDGQGGLESPSLAEPRGRLPMTEGFGGAIVRRRPREAVNA